MNQTGTKGRFGAYGLNSCQHTHGYNCWRTNLPKAVPPVPQNQNQGANIKAPGHLSSSEKKEYVRSEDKKRKFENFQNKYQFNYKRQKHW